MPSFKSTILAVAAGFVATASAQDYYSLDPETIAPGIRVRWCSDQLLSCKGICAQTSDGEPLVNDCDAEVLRYGCICSDNNKPNMSEYSLTLPYHMCSEWGNQCVANCGIGNNQCSQDCRVNNLCGAQDPQRINATSSTATPEPTADTTRSSNDGIFTGMDGDSGDDEDDDLGNGGSAAAALQANGALGFALLAGSVVGGFAFLL